MTSIAMKSESWKVVPGYEKYEVSDAGNVRIIDGQIMKQHASWNGYLRVGLRSNGQRKHLLVHRLVAAAFIGPCPEGMQVNHIDENRTNNQASNLEYVTPKENVNHGGCLAKRAFKRGVPVAQYSVDGYLIAVYPSLKEAAKNTGACTSNICNCCNGKAKTAKGYAWMYADGRLL